MENQRDEVTFSDRLSIGIETIARFPLVDITLSDGSQFGFGDFVLWAKGDVQGLSSTQKDDLIRIFSEQLVAQVASQYLITP